MPNDYELSTPKPCALIESLRSVGYTLPTAIADILDNSITAGAENVWIDFYWYGPKSRISILDDGDGMDEAKLAEAMRPGSSNPLDTRGASDLGRFGLGLKTASFSQCRRLTVWSKVEKGSIVGRCWDLDYVAKHNEWRLKKVSPPERLEAFNQLASLNKGTLVLWEELDRVVGGESPDSRDAHNRFLGLLPEVGDHLAMTFNRFLSGATTQARRGLRIYLGGIKEIHRLKPWNPFTVPGVQQSKETPTETITVGNSVVSVKGFVLPHKDRLTDQQFKDAAGPKGWIAQQGYYIYRNDRILLAGDWLGLGRGRQWAKEEQYKLARMSIDIPNAMDHAWSLDIKKSTAKPPAVIRERLTDLAEQVRVDARRVFAHRGEYGPRPLGPEVVVERPWSSTQRAGRIVYKINRSHPLVQRAVQRLGPLASEMEAVLRLAEETVPVQKIWLNTAESESDHAIPYEGYEDATVLGDLRKVRDFLKGSISNAEVLKAYLLATEPFNRYPMLVDKVTKEL